MKIKIVQRYLNRSIVEADMILLTWNSWNDYGFLTVFGIIYFDQEMNRHNIGNVRIGYYGQKDGDRRLSKEDELEFLSDEFFSLGAGTEYYENLKRLKKDQRESILHALRDIAYNPSILELAQHEEVTKSSLFRGLDIATVKGQYHRMALGGAKLTNFRFWFNSPKIRPESPEMKLSFKVVPESNPPTNIHVIIGRNGVGKTSLINNMISSLYHGEEEMKTGLYFKEADDRFVNVVQISFSAFDMMVPFFDRESPETNIEFKYIGLKREASNSALGFSIKSGPDLSAEFRESFTECLETFKTDNLIKGIRALESDPNFKEADILQLLDLSGMEFEKKAKELFDKLSSGHMIILLSITRLIETVQEKTLVFIDEPEAHLHPPLLSAFTRSLSELLIDLNGVCIIATHSPVILQEVPQNCVYKLQRFGANASATRPEIQTFGENVGILTREIFGLEVTDSGFYQLLKKAVSEVKNYEELLEYFDGELGMEARSIARVLFANQRNQL
ncbi:AAA family ATPase [Pedobacter jeongneungensis]|uniref:AAA family ATPase n=1 Tax=Pedobacter jeongneungensis TaxID=947309 RepID=UPI000468F3FF|nr:AAA family ATPase [Pedobacter jeongneungensis]